MKKQTRTSKKAAPKSKAKTPVKKSATPVHPEAKPVISSTVVPLVDPVAGDIVTCVPPVADNTVQSVITFSGSVKHSTGNGIGGLNVVIYQRDVFSKTQLAKATTDNSGNYSASFSRLAESNLAFQVEVQTKEGCTLTSSDVLLKIDNTNNIDFTLTGSESNGTTRFSQHSDLLGDVLAQVKQNISGQKLSGGDLYRIANNKGCTDTDAFHWLKAQECSDNTGIAAEVFFGLFKSGLPADLNLLGFCKGDEIRKALQDAAANNHISDDTATNADNIVQQWYGYLSKRALSAKADQLDASLGDILSIAVEDKEVHQQIMLSYLNNAGTLEDFWNNLHTVTGSEDSANSVNLVLRLAAFNGMQPYMTQAMLEESKKYKNKNYLRILARFDKWAMNKLITIWNNQFNQDTIVPKFVEGEDENERSIKYAEVLTDKLKKIFPTCRLLGDLSRKKSVSSAATLRAAGAEPADTTTAPGWDDVFETPMSEIISFLQKNFEFDFESVTKSTFGVGNGLNWSGITDKNTVIKDSWQLKLMFAYNTNIENIITLINAGIRYSGDIVAMPQKTWVQKFAYAYASEEEAEEAYSVASTINQMCFPIYGMIHPGLNTQLGAVPSIKDNPVMAECSTIFGRIETCEFEQCMSVFGPSFYFADILNYIRNKVGDEESDGVTNAYAKLLQRRNELKLLDLSCGNANPPMPYVDLVIELLENYILNLSGKTHLPESFQTSGTADI